MVILIGLIVGFAVGWWRAKRRGGNRLDCLQYAAAHSIAFALVAFIFALAAVRVGLA